MWRYIYIYLLEWDIQIPHVGSSSLCESLKGEGTEGQCWEQVQDFSHPGVAHSYHVSHVHIKGWCYRGVASLCLYTTLKSGGLKDGSAGEGNHYQAWRPANRIWDCFRIRLYRLGAKSCRLSPGWGTQLVKAVKPSSPGPSKRWPSIWHSLGGQFRGKDWQPDPTSVHFSHSLPEGMTCEAGRIQQQLHCVNLKPELHVFILAMGEAHRCVTNTLK